MGSRASFATVRDGRTRLYYSHWAATTLPQTLVFGPEYALRYIEGLAPAEDLLDEVWCEGAVLLDLDARRLTFFCDDSRYTPGLLPYYLRLLRHYWPGWEVRWADRGVIDVAVALGLDPDSVRSETDEDDFVPEPLGVEPPEYVNTLVTVRRAGVVSDYGFETYVTKVLAHGPGLVDALQGLDDTTPVGEDDLEDGAFLDADRKEMWVWWRHTGDERHVGRLARLWPGWTVRRHTEGLRRQVELSGRDGSHVGPDEAAAVRRLVELLSEESGFDPRKALERIVGQTGEDDFTVAPGFFRTDKPDLGAAAGRGMWDHVGAAFRARPGD